MQNLYCPTCAQDRGFKRSLGFGTFFAVVITLGWWLLAIPFYPKRCIHCGQTWNDAVMFRRQRRQKQIEAGVEPKDDGKVEISPGVIVLFAIVGIVFLLILSKIL